MTLTLNQPKMNISNKIDKLLYNNLTENEKRQFENELLVNPELSKSYKTYSKANSLFEESLASPLFDDAEDPILKELNTEQKLKIEEDFIKYRLLNEASKDQSELNGNTEYTEDELNFLEKLHPNSKEEKLEGKSGIFKVFIGVAATIALTIATGKYLLEIPILQATKLSPQKAFLSYYNPSKDPELKSLILNNIKQNNSISQDNRSSFNDYSNDAISQGKYELSLLYRGIINIEKKNLSETKKCFDLILGNRSNNVSNNIHICLYYYALVYLSEGNFQDAKPFLVELSQGNSSYSKKSRKLLKSVIDN